MVARLAHNQEAVGSTPAPTTKNPTATVLAAVGHLSATHIARIGTGGAISCCQKNGKAEASCRQVRRGAEAKKPSFVIHPF